MKRLIGFAMAAAFVLGPLSARADVKALEDAAKKEGEITWYVAHYTSEAAEELGSTFTKLYSTFTKRKSGSLEEGFSAFFDLRLNNSQALLQALMNRSRGTGFTR